MPPRGTVGESDPAEPDTFDNGDLMVLAKVSIVILAIGAVLAGYAGYRHFRLASLDDYRDGYAVGATWRDNGVHGDCLTTMESRYGGGSWTDRSDGWGEFMVGCQDGLAGEQEAAWYQLRDRLWGTDGVD
jgi:hypothetical protein